MSHRGGGQSVHFVHTSTAQCFVPLAERRVNHGSNAKAQGAISSPMAVIHPSTKWGWNTPPMTLWQGITPGCAGANGQIPPGPENRSQQQTCCKMCSNRHCPGSKMYKQARILWHLGFFIYFEYLWNGCHEPTFLWCFSSPQQVPAELSRVLRLVGLGLSESPAWETRLPCTRTFCFHMRSDRRKSRSLVPWSMTTRASWRWRSKGVWNSISGQTKNTVLENESVFIDIPHSTRIISLHSAVGCMGTSIP